uniref:RING-type E3 ubiquitin transferase n=1 Tax=Propithecus coquereli TaxID=379532 RepID=A0A2K6F2Z7_PROCO
MLRRAVCKAGGEQRAGPSTGLDLTGGSDSHPALWISEPTVLRCRFLLQSKGRDFVHSAREAHPRLQGSWDRWEEPEDAPLAPVVLWELTPRREAQTEGARQPGAGAAEEELRQLRQERTCKVCLDRAVSVVFVPCGHLACAECAPSLQLCPICRAPVHSRVRTFLS